MILPLIYIGFFFLTIVLFFVKKDCAIKYKYWLNYVHIASLLFLAVDIYLITYFNSSFKTTWIDRLIAISFFTSGALTFVLFRKTLKLWTKIYFGVFFFYPAISAFTFLLDRIFFIIVASPLIVTLLSPEIYYTGKNYDIRTDIGIMAPKQLTLIKKDIFTETEIGKCSDEFIGNGDYKNFKIIMQNKDSTIVSVIFDRKQTNLTFRK